MTFQKPSIFFTCSLTLIVLVSAFILLRNIGIRSDEALQYGQIKQILQKDLSGLKANPIVPGYHAIIAGIAATLKVDTLPNIRAISFVVALLSILAFYLVSRDKNEATPITRALQYCFFPIILPYYFLVYTDVFSLMIVLFSTYALQRKKYEISGLLAILSFLVRQNNIVWLAFLFVYLYVETNGYKFEIEALIKTAKKLWVFIMGGIIFTLYVVINKGIAYGQESMHPSFSFHLGNLFFILFLFFFLLLPLNISNFPEIARFIKRKKTLTLSILTFSLLCYVFLFKNDHPWNQGGYYAYWLRNRLLVAIFSSGILMKLIAFIPIAYSILSLCVTRLRKKSYYLLYPFTVLCLISHWLIEARYHIIPFALFLAFREKRSGRVEYLLITLNVILSAVFLYIIWTGRFFL